MEPRKRPLTPRDEYAMRYYASGTYQRARAREKRHVMAWPLLILVVCCSYAAFGLSILAATMP